MSKEILVQEKVEYLPIIDEVEIVQPFISIRVTDERDEYIVEITDSVG